MDIGTVKRLATKPDFIAERDGVYGLGHRQYPMELPGLYKRKTEYIQEEELMELLEIMKNRRSVRKYTGEAVPEEKLEMILKAGLLAPSGRNLKPWEFILVRDKDMLKRLSECRPHGSGILADADAAIVVVGNTQITDVWAEDCSIAMTQMHLMADSLGVGSCWVQGRLRPSPDGKTADEVVKKLLQIPDPYALEAILCLGMPQNHPKAHGESELLTERIHREIF